jgi:serine/threonine-protein kinase
MSELLEQLRTSLADHYAIERELGRGGMATVFLARDLKHDRPVAVKVLLPDLSVALGPERFRREIDVATHVSHPHILPLYDSGEANGLLYYVMPFVEGRSLRDRLIAERQLPLDQSLRIACQVASALDHAHKHGIVHRDIKPENILLEGDQALIADFGIARALSAVGDEKLTKTGISLGTPSYMSPEQAMADPHVDGRSDIYSLGCVLYEMLAGEPPFTGPTAQAVIARHALAEVPSLTVARSTISDDVEDAVLRAMSKVPADRFATAGEFAEALMACQETGGRSLGKHERRGRTRPKAKRTRRRTAGLSIAAAILLLGSMGWFAWPLVARGTHSQDANGVLSADQGRVAVLYFDDNTGGELRELADGLTEGVIAELRSVSAVDVISPNGVAPFRNSDAISTDSIGRMLKVGTIVRGSVDRIGKRIKVDVRVLDGPTGTQTGLATSIERPESELLAIRDSVPARVAMLLREELGREIRLRTTRAETRSAPAWMHYQRAERERKDARRLATVDSVDASRRKLAIADSLFAVAETLDPRWPDPILARATMALGQVTPTRDNAQRDSLITVGLAHTTRALAIDSTNAQALELRGTLRYMKRFHNLAPDPAEAASLLRTAEEDLEKAVKLDETRASAWSTLSLLRYRNFDRLGARDAALKAYEKDAYLESAREIMWRLYATSYDLENFDHAKRWCDDGNRRYPTDPQFATCRLWLMTAETGQPPSIPAAWAALDSIKARVPATRWETVRRGYEMLVAVPIARAGNRDSALHVIERARGNKEVDPSGELIGREVLVQTLIGEKKAALELLSSYLAAYPQHREGFVKGNTWWWRSFKNDTTFQKLVGG